jgi:putative membrane protein
MKKTEIKLSKIFSENRVKVYFIAVVCSLTLLETSCNHNDDDNNNNNANGTASSVSSQGTFNNNDKSFIDSAAASGMAEVQLGQMAASKASNETVRSFGQRMVTDHTTANNQLLQIAKNKNVTTPTQLDPAHQALMNRLSSLSGLAFDTAYINSQVADHRKAVNLFQAEVNNSSGDPSVRGFASSNLPILNMHLQSAQSIQSNLNGTNTSATTSGTTNGSTNGTTSGSSNGTTSGSTSGTTSGSSNGTTSGTTNGSTSSTTSSSTTMGSTTMGSSSGTTGGY